jgi:hypothetical protein
MKAFQGVLLGLVLFVVSFGLLYWNEGRVDVSDIAKKAIIIEAANVQANTAAEGQLVSASGTVSAEPLIGDNLYLKPGAYLTVERQVEVLAWVEKSETVTRTDSNGVETSETEYSYLTEFTRDPADSSKFHEPEGHTNIAPAIPELTITTDSARVGQYDLTPEVIQMPSAVTLQLTPDMVSLTENASILAGNSVYVRISNTGAAMDADLGDLRISYQVVKIPFEGTAFGQLDGATIDPYVTKQGDTFYRLFSGSHEQSLALMHGEYKTGLWAFRFIGFLLMWFGLWSLFGPLSRVLDFVPVVGGIGKAFIAFATLAVAFVLSAVTILVSAILHSLLAVIIVVAVILFATLGGGVVAKKNKLSHVSPVVTK